MRYFEIQGGVRMPVNEEEQELLEAAQDQELADDDLDERRQEVARKMVSRGLFNRLDRDGKLYYCPNSLVNTWRF